MRCLPASSPSKESITINKNSQHCQQEGARHFSPQIETTHNQKGNATIPSQICKAAWEICVIVIRNASLEYITDSKGDIFKFPQN